jgi:membrane associated rhomboid family serine protease
MPCPVFQPGMYVRAKVIGYNIDEGTYKLRYQDGPYLAHEEGDGAKHFQVPPGTKATIIFEGVKSTYLTVDLFDNYGSHLPIFIVFISIVQLLMFLSYLMANPDKPVSASTPIAGPPGRWMRVVDVFPLCTDLRLEWWRLLAYQLVHAGYQHIGFNLVMQTIFGLPLNMVHGNLRFGTIYMLGVIGGGMTFSVIGGAHGALVGCSGGVYAIIGMHLAEIIVNWDVESKGLMNHWTRLLVIGVLLCIDFFLYYLMPSETTSYSAHIGGWMVGLVMGVVLLDNLEVEWCEKYVLFPLTAFVAVVLAIALPAYYFKGPYPPEPLLFPVDADPCCWQLLKCPGVAPQHYELFKCYDLYDVKGGRHFRDTCAEFEQHVEQYYSPYCKGPYCAGYTGIMPEDRTLAPAASPV